MGTGTVDGQHERGQLHFFYRLVDWLRKHVLVADLRGTLINV